MNQVIRRLQSTLKQDLHLLSRGNLGSEPLPANSLIKTFNPRKQELLVKKMVPQNKWMIQKD